MLKWINGLIDRIFVVIFALIFSQAPLFMQQYKQQLSGHVAELHIQIDSMRRAAQISGKTLDVYIRKFLQNADPDFSRQGELMQGMTNRYSNLLNAYQALNDATVYSRPFAFIKHVNLDIAKRTLHNYEFGFLFSIEGLAYALLGGTVGYFIYALFSRFLASLFPNKRKTV